MTSERSLWHTVRRHLGPHGVLHRVENTAATGTPDVAYCLRGCAGWLELKEIEWPKRPTTLVTIRTLTREQVVFLRSWEAAGGAAHLLLHADRTVLLLTPETAELIRARTLPRAAIETRAVATVRAGDWSPVLRALTPRRSR